MAIDIPFSETFHVSVFHHAFKTTQFLRNAQPKRFKPSPKTQAFYELFSRSRQSKPLEKAIYEIFGVLPKKPSDILSMVN